MSSSSRDAASFGALFGLRPSAAAAAPGRVNLIGEYTDLNEGFVLPTATRRCTRVEVALSPDDRFRYHAANLDETVTLPETASPASGFARYVHGCVEVLRGRGERVPPVVLRIESDLPLGSGLSSSAALCVATLRALRALLHLRIDDLELAHLARQAETEYAGVRTGLLDQLACSFCGPDQMLLIDTRTLDRRVLPMPAGTELVVLHSGVERELGNTAYNTRRAECEAAARALGLGSLRDLGDITGLVRLDPLLRRRARHVVTENQRVLAAADADARGFGALMNASHQSLRDDFEVSVPALDLLVNALQADPDVLGARLTGAGFGGACIALVRAGRAPEVAARALAVHAAAGYRGWSLA
jgi:galactokinase